MNTTPPALPSTPSKKDPLAITALIFGIIGFFIAIFCGLLCWIGRDSGGGLFFIGFLLLLLGIIIHIGITILALIVVIKRRNLMTISACALNVTVIPFVLIILLLAFAPW